MKTFTLPDKGPLAGRELIIPDDPNLRAQVGYAISQIPEYGPDVAEEYTEGTFLGQATESLKGIPRGIAQTTLSGLRGPVELLAQDSLGEGPLVRLADKIKATEEKVAQNIAGYRDPRYADAFTTKAGQAFGSIIPFAGLGLLAGKGASYLPMMKPGTKGFGKVNPLNFNAKFLKSKPFLYPAGLGTSVYMANNADMMDIAEEVYGEDKPGFFAENLSTLTAGVIGASEALPIFNFFRSIPKSALRDAPTSAKIFNHVRNFTAGGIQEGLQESTAGLLQDFNARGFYSDELPIGDSLFDDFTVGGFAGGLLNTIMQGYGGRRGIASEYRAEKEKRAEQKKQDLLKTKKFDIAQQQGVINIADPTLDDSVEEALLLPLLDNIPKPVEVSTVPQLQIRKNQNNTFSLIDNNLGEVNSFTKEVDAIKEKEKLLKDYEVNEETQILNNDLYILGLNKSPQAYELGQTVIDNDTTTASLKEIVPYDTSLKTPEAMQKVLMGTNKKYKNLPLKENYTFEEVKKILSKKDFNNFITDTSQQVAVVSSSKNIPSVIENNNKTNVTIGRLKEIGDAKNINIDINSPAFEYAAKRWTGTSSFKTMTKPQKELLLARIQSIPRFNTKENFPNLQPRMYSAQEVADTVTNLKKDNVLFNQKSLGMMGIKDPQFFEDLVYSGRAEKVKGNQYKIADNFQEKIDSRAGAFNETTEEFVNRLVTEGRLSPEAISQLEQEQKITESQQLPPKEEAQKTIDFAESVQQGKTNKFAQELRKRLARIGLKETGVVVSNDILSTSTLLEKTDGSIEFQGIDKTTEGEYDRQTDIIFISLNAVNPDGKATDAEIQRKLNEVLDHELIHALREKDLITEKEYDYLKKQVKKKRVPKSVDAIAFNKKETYYDRAIRINKRTFDEFEKATATKRPKYFSPATKEELYTEEAIAEMYRNRRVESPLPEKAEGIYNKIIEFFAEVGESLRISGFDNANQIFDQIQAGRVGKRARDKIRTTKLLDKGAAPVVGEMLDEVDDDYLDTPLFARRGPRDETSGHVADYVPAQYGPPAHQLDLEASGELTPEGYPTASFGFTYPKTSPDYRTREFTVYSTARTPQEIQEEREFVIKLMEIRGNPNATITMYQAAPQRDLREGDLITPFLSEAEALVEDSKVTREEIREADRARRRQEQIDKTGAVDLQQEKLYNQMDKAFDIGGPFPDRTPSRVHTFKLRAGDIRWDGNNGWARWGYFPRIKAVEDIPTFSRESDDAYFANEKRKRTISNLEAGIEFKEAQLNSEKMAVSTANRLKKEIQNQKNKIAELRAGDLPTFSRAATETQPPYMDFNRQQIKDFSSNRVGFYNGVEIPLTHVTRMNVDDFLKLTTFDQEHINDIMEEGPTVLNRQFTTDAGVRVKSPLRKASAIFDPEIADTALNASLPSLQIQRDGQVIRHEGRHRVALIKQGGGRTVPVFIHFPEGNVEQNIPNPSGQTLQEQGVTSLKNENKFNIGIEYTEEFFNFELPINKLKEIAPLHRDSAQTKDKLDYAVQVATAPDIQADIPLFSRGRRDSQRKFNDFYYHVTETKNVKNILNKGFNPLSDTNFVRKGTGERFQKDMGLFAFNNPVDAIEFFRSVMWKKELSDLTILAIKKDGNWVQDPAQESGGIGAGLDNRAIKSPDSNITVIPESISKPTNLKVFNNIPTSFFLPKSNNSSYFNNPNNILGSATLEELTQTEINPYFGKPLDETGLIPQVFYGPKMDDLILKNGYGNLASNETELANIVTKYMNDIANILNPPPPSKALEEVIETVNNTARGGIPVYNLNASDTALEAAKEYIEDEAALLPGDIPNYSNIAPTLDGVDASIREGIKQTGSQTSPQNSMGYRFIDVAKDNISGAIEYFYNNFREQLIDKADKAQKAIVKMSEENEQVRRLNNTADTSTQAAIRLMDRARGLFQGMLNTGYISSTIQGIDSLSNTKQLTISTKYNPFIDGDTGTGGLMQILAPLYGTPTDLESIFKYYALLKRKKGFDKSGRNIETPITQKNLNDIRKIESTYPQVVEAYQNYQRWNNKLIKFAVDKGLLSKTRNVSELARDISAITKENENDLLQLSYEELMNKANVLNRTLTLDKQIETRGTAEIWATNSDYYPFYRKMTDDTIAGPNIANGSLPNNPLNIKIEGSAKQIDVDVIEAISRNSLAILTAALKNDGSAKLIRDMEIYGSAKEITPIEISKNPKLKNNLDVVTVFENGLKKYYQVKNVEAFNVFKEVGGTPSGLMTTVFGGFASTLRDTVTRDPGFVMVNLLRDSLSTMVTSGANYTPVLDTLKNMIADMSELERFGVIGGYDFQNDEGSIKRYIKRNMRLSGLTEENGMSAKKAFFMVWDGLGDLTTKSDGATRLAVYNAIYDKLKKEGYNEAQAQSEAAFQALEIINFGRRGANPGFRFITAAIPFLNARVQGLDVLWRSSTGQYSAAEKLGKNETIKEVQKRIQLDMAQNAGALIALTLAYYLMYHDDEEYKNLKREVRDDNWVFPIAKDFSIKIPIPFEVGLLFKVIPERVFDMTMGDDAFTRKSVDEAMKTIGRGTQTSLNIPFFQPGGGFQLLKPISEVLNNRNTFTGQEIVPYYQQKKAPGLQARPTTNFLVKEIAEYFNISPAKVEHVIRGYTGTLGGHVLNLIDVTARGVTGENILPSNVSLNRIPLFNRVLMNTDQAGGLQQQFYELRTEVDGAVQTINDLKNKGRMDEYNAYRNSMQGVLNVKGQVRKMERYLTKWRKRRDAILRNKNISLTAKQDALERLELERDRRLAMVPELRKRANIPITHMGTF